jgi:hypothetical protein
VLWGKQRSRDARRLMDMVRFAAALVVLVVIAGSVTPATRTRTTLRLRGIPRAQYVTLAW